MHREHPEFDTMGVSGIMALAPPWVFHLVLTYFLLLFLGIFDVFLFSVFSNKRVCQNVRFILYILKYSNQEFRLYLQMCQDEKMWDYQGKYDL